MSSNTQVYILYSISSRSIILLSKVFGQCSPHRLFLNSSTAYVDSNTCTMGNPMPDSTLQVHNFWAPILNFALFYKYLCINIKVVDTIVPLILRLSRVDLNLY
jgi:hypothetical protein